MIAAKHDDPDFVALTKRWLEREGHAVSVAVTGPAALDIKPLMEYHFLGCLVVR